jgi:hypothetical protein
MPREVTLNAPTTEDGVVGRYTLIRGEPRFIPDDPLNKPGAEVFLPDFTGLGDVQVAGGATGAAVIGLGESITNADTRFNAAVDTLQGRAGTEAQQEFADIKELLGPLQKDHPFATAVGQSIPGFLLPSAKAAQTLGGAAEGALADPENPILGGAIGAAGGFLGGVIGQKLATRVAARGSGAAATLAKRGIPTTLAQRTGSELDKAVESGVSAIPILSSWLTKPARAQQRALNRGAGSVFGFEGKLNPEGLGQVRAGISRSFDQVQAAIPDQQLPGELVERLDDLGVLDKATKEFMQGFGLADGEALMAIRSNLNNDMADAFINANRKEGRQLRAALNEVDDLITGSMPEELVQQWATARQQWQFLTAISKGKAITGGNVNLASMNTALRSIYPNFRFGKDLPGTAQGFGELIQALDDLPRALQSSGSAERAAATAALTGVGFAEPSTLALPLLATARAVGQPGIDVGATAGIAASRPLERAIADALQSSEPTPSSEESALQPSAQ